MANQASKQISISEIDKDAQLSIIDRNSENLTTDMIDEWLKNNPEHLKLILSRHTEKNQVNIIENNFKSSTEDEKQIDNNINDKDQVKESTSNENLEQKSYAHVLIVDNETEETVSPHIIKGRLKFNNSDRDLQTPVSNISCHSANSAGRSSPFSHNNLDEVTETGKKLPEFANEYYVTVLEMKDRNIPYLLKLYTVFSILAPDKFDKLFKDANDEGKESISIKQVDGTTIYNVQIKRGWKHKQAKIKYINTDKWVDNTKSFYGYERLNFTYTKCNKKWKPEFICSVYNSNGIVVNIKLDESKENNNGKKNISQELFTLDKLFNDANKNNKKNLEIKTDNKVYSGILVQKGWTVNTINYKVIEEVEIPKNNLKSTESKSAFVKVQTADEEK